MNSLLNLKRFFIFIIFLSASYANAQCTIINNPPSPNTTNNSGTYDYVQSFTATCSGDMQYFQLTSAAVGTLPGATLNVYDGNVSSGTPIYTQAYSDIVITTIGDPITINITGALPLVSGNQYSFRYTATTLDFLFSSGGAYAGGHVWQDGSPLPTTDFVFEIAIGTCAATSILADVASLPDVTGDCSVTIGTAPTATNSCGTVVNGVPNVSFPITAQGTTQITWSYDDGQGNTTSQIQNVINPTVDNTVTVSGPTIQSNQSGAAYQWLDCDTAFTPIGGETNQSFTATITGNYAVEINLLGCVDTSACELIDFAGIEELTQENKELVKIVDLLGRETTFKTNTPLIFIYRDGTMKRVMEIE